MEVSYFRSIWHGKSNLLQTILLKGEDDSSEVHAVWEDDDNLSATITTADDVYVVEVWDCISSVFWFPAKFVP